MNSVYIVSMARTATGSFGASLSRFSATHLGALAVREAVIRSGIPPQMTEQVIMGNVCSANLGQAPARQAALGGGLDPSTICTTVNKVCASGMKSVALGAQSILSGESEVVVAGGMESMSNIPYYAEAMRWGARYGHGQIIDGLQKDGLTDVYSKNAMGQCGDATASKYGITREAQDAYAIRSYQLAQQATENGYFDAEIFPVEIPQKKGVPVMFKTDEEIYKVDFDKIPSLRPSFTPDGTVTAANASTINDGASALVLASENQVKSLGLKPLARIVSFADAEQAPEWFTTTPTLAAPRALKKAGLQWNDISCIEVNEAFAVVPMVFAQKLNLDPQMINAFGGAVALGHALGSSGSRILCTLISVLGNKKGRYGLASICNGGGGASAMVVENLQ
ncbi:MAG: Acetyl-CoA acetyltransferase [Saprospiraceae bacterium]|jgi:acetyl-CoA C-acetyltransferase|nr:Acetyl-CoA acetyltransferase [Saprospiraceae bacterium]